VNVFFFGSSSVIQRKLEEKLPQTLEPVGEKQMVCWQQGQNQWQQESAIISSILY
jgi:hypothetical protein